MLEEESLCMQPRYSESGQLSHAERVAPQAIRHGGARAR